MQNKPVSQRKENEHGKELFKFQVTKTSLPTQATTEDQTNQAIRIKTRIRTAQKTAAKMQMMSTK